ncbi:DeoR/GlpR family DNA-binding transcription regulator [Faecalibaculum rodentium]|nr:DeoR/GlpR family DNA-binding transcription regulator [Faecalibaculum rodentium]
MNTDKKARQRQAAIRDLLQKQEVVTIREFCETLHASVATIRKDLTLLEERGCLRRVRGGAVSTEGTPRNTVYVSRLHLNEQEKTQIADQAVRLIQPHMKLILDAGTTCARLAQRILEEEIPCTVWTPNLTAIQILSRSPKITLMSAGGILDRDHNRFQGPVPGEFYADLYFLSPDGFCCGQATGTDQEESLRKRSFASQSDKVICLVEPSKEGRVAPFEIFCPAVTITEKGISSK